MPIGGVGLVPGDDAAVVTGAGVSAGRGRLRPGAQVGGVGCPGEKSAQFWPGKGLAAVAAAGVEVGGEIGQDVWSPCTLVDRFPLCRIYIRNVNRLLKAHRAHFPQAALFPDAVVIPLDVVEYRGPGLFGIQPQMLVDELFLDRGVK